MQAVVKPDDPRGTRDKLPPLPDGHGFAVGDKVVQPVYGNGLVRGTVEYIDVISPRGDRYRGLVMLGENGRYYELHAEIAKKIE